MEKFLIKGPCKVKGDVIISGAKNSVLPLLAASILFDKIVILKNVPFVQDVHTMCKLLQTLGSTVEISTQKKTIKILKKKKLKLIVPYNLVKTMRAGVLAMGPLLGKYHKCKVSLPGGCNLGLRKINFHLNGFNKLGAKFKIIKGYVNISSKKGLVGNNVFRFPKITVTGTSNLIMASIFSNGITTLKNISIEPEVIDLINFLNKGGAKIKFIGKRTLAIKGINSLKSVTHEVIGDRIEAFSYLCVAAITGGSLKIEKINPKFLANEINVLKKIGCKLKVLKNSIFIKGVKKIKPTKVKTSPYPGFATDNMPLLMSVLSLSKGKSEILETIFENRFMAAPELNRMNASISIKNNKAIIIGKNNLQSAECMASDLRSCFAIIIAALAASGTSLISRIYNGRRGYYQIEKKLRSIGANIRRIT